MQSRSLPYVMALLAAAAVLAAVWVVDRLEQERFREANRTSVIQRLSTVRARLEGALSARLFLTQGLLAHVSTHPEITRAEFEALARVLVAERTGIRSIQLAKKTAVTHIYPVKGNEKARGLRLMDLPDQRPAVQRALDTRKTVVAGPVDLVQGGVAFVSRTPIYLTLPGRPPASGPYWGLATIIIDTDTLLKEAGLFDDSAGLQYGLRGKDGLGTHGEIFFGNAALFESHPVVLDVYLPNGSWQLAAVPVGGWAAVSPQVWPVRVGGGLLALLAAGLAYMATLYQMRGQGREKALREAHEEVERRVQERTAELSDSEGRFRRVLETAPDGMVLVRPDGTIALANDQMEKLFGYSSEELVGQGIEMLALEGFRTEQAQQRRNDFGDSRVRPRGAGLELYGRRKDGTEVPLEIRLSPLEAQEGVLVCAAIRDVTERKRAEEALRESEARFRTMANTAPVMIWMSGTDKLCTFFNKGWLDFTGRSLEQELGNGWAEGVHREDLDRCLEVYVSSFDAQQEFTMECRLRRHDGEYCWVLDTGVPRFAPDGTFVGYIGSAIDITGRKRTEEALRELSGRLISAQEEERRRVARELHDDLTQRLAVVAIEAGKLEQQLQGGSEPVLERLRRMKEQMIELSAVVHGISRQLHPSILDDLGLVNAIEAECMHFSQREGIQVTFRAKAVPAALPRDIALCLYRILQGGLRNIAKHASTTKADVALTAQDGSIMLSVGDHGIGFDPAGVRGKRGLGLASMEERVRLIRGRLSIRSEPGKGTIIEAWAPVAGGDE